MTQSNGPNPKPAYASLHPTQPDQRFTLTVEEASRRYAGHGHSRSPRSVRRYCRNGKIRCAGTSSPGFEKAYLIDPNSIDRHIREIENRLGRKEEGDHHTDRATLSGERSNKPVAGPPIEHSSDVIVDDANSDTREKTKLNESWIGTLIDGFRDTKFLWRGFAMILMQWSKAFGNADKSSTLKRLASDL